jgi:glucose uptake protein
LLIPTTYASTLFLVLISLICLGSWANTFKLAGKRWPYELFYIDFAIGALVLAIVFAYTLGIAGDLPFADRMLVAGRTAQAWVGLAGFIFNFGNILLLASVSLIGMAAAFPLAAGTALIIVCIFHIRTGTPSLLVCGAVLILLAIVLTARACHRRLATHKDPAREGGKRIDSTGKEGRGILTALLGGVALGLFFTVAENGMDPEFGVGPYAGILLFCLGLFCSTILFHFFFLNMAIGGTRVRFSDYFRGKAPKHLLGFAGGAVLTAGILAAMLVTAAPQVPTMSSALPFILPVASVLLAMFWGIAAWKEFSASARGAKPALAGAAILFLGGLVVIGFGLTS